MKQILVEEQPSQTLAKGLLILEAFSPKRRHWRVRELARELDLSPATVVRLVTTLQNSGYLEQDPVTQRYSLGPMVMRLGNLYAYHNPLTTLARKTFEKYTDKFDYNFYLGKLSRYQVIYMAALDGRGPIKVVVEPGGTTGLHSTALGKVLLAFQDESYIEEFLHSNHLIRYTPNSITDAERLWQQIEQIRQTGYALNNGEHFEDVGAVGAPVLNQSREVVAGVSLAYPRPMIQDGRIDPLSLVGLVKQIADDITMLFSEYSPQA